MRPSDVLNSRARRRFASSVALTLTAAAFLAGPSAFGMADAEAAPAGDSAEGPTATVSLGDSYISGEAGRWAGNSGANQDGAWSGTDRGAQVYGDSGRCHRSDSAEVKSAGLPGEAENLACSGAVAADVYKSGGQADQLAELAKRKRIGVVVMSLGGNDLDFKGTISDCAKGFILGNLTGSLAGYHCHGDQQKRVDEKSAGAKADITRAATAVRNAMSQAGYGNESYRLVLQSYPSPLPDARGNAFMGKGYRDHQRWTIGGCPFHEDDSDWARRKLVPQISAMIKEVARTARAEFMDVQDLLTGHEVCAADSKRASLTQKPGEREWARFIWPSYTEGKWDVPQQGDVEEFMHPNYYGQQALGHCLKEHVQRGVGDSVCAGAAGIEPYSVRWSRLSG